MTNHKIYFRSSINMEEIENESVALVVTSPPYPMIDMWNEIFAFQDYSIKMAFMKNNNDLAFYLMHEFLNKVWDEIYRILMPGGIACINIGDATKTVDGIFRLYPNHTKIIDYFMKKGFYVLPDIIWRKQTNAPNKFMGSGMYPPGAYVTFEHEYILIFRKGGIRKFVTEEEKKIRHESAYFWEERNVWFSDVWDLKGTNQSINSKNFKTKRGRSGAFPFELAYRLINMYSVKNDIVVDPFLGTGTTTIAAIASERNSIGYEIDFTLEKLIDHKIKNSITMINDFINQRILKHIEFIEGEISKKTKLYKSNYYDFYVKTKQEQEILIKKVNFIDKISHNEYLADYRLE